MFIYFLLSAGANLLKTKLETYILQTGQFISYKYVCKSILIELAYSIVKDSNVDLTVGNGESKIDPYIISNSSGLA